MTAQEIIVFVTRQDLYNQRARAVFQDNVDNIKQTAPTHKIDSRIKKVDEYYNKLIPILYSRFGGVWGMLRKLLV